MSLHPNQPFLAFPHSIRTHSLTPLSFSLLSISLSFLLYFPQSSLQLSKPFHFQLSRACKPRKFDFPLNSNLYLWLIVCLTPLDSLNLSTRSSIFRISLSFASHSIGELNLDDRQNNLWKRGVAVARTETESTFWEPPLSYHPTRTLDPGRVLKY